jgi:hypothetical protein
MLHISSGLWQFYRRYNIGPCLSDLSTDLFLGKVSAGRFRKAMSHQNDRQFQSYISDTIGVDTQSLVKGIAEESKHTDLTQSIAFTRDLSIPKPHGSTLDKRHDPVPSKDTLRQVQAKFPNARTSDIRRKARKEEYRKLRDTHMNTPKLAADTERITESAAGSRVNPEPTREFHLMLKYNTLQASVIDSLWSGKGASFQVSTPPLMALSREELPSVWYPEPIKPPTRDMCCPYCDKDIKNSKKGYKAEHIMDCFEAGIKGSFCFDCVKVKEATHVCFKLRREDLSCGAIYWRDLLIKPGWCVYCENTWNNGQNLKVHVNRHVTRLRGEGPYICPHPKCAGGQFHSKDDLRAHHFLVHGISLEQKRSVQEMSAGIGIDSKCDLRVVSPRLI